MVQEVEWTKRAMRDLQDIYEFISKDSPKYAEIQIREIQDTVLILRHFPNMGRKIPEFKQSPYRELLFGSYRIIYKQNKENHIIFIMAVIHSHRLLKINLIKQTR